MIYTKTTKLQKGLSLIGVVVAVSILASSAIVITRLIVEVDRLSMVSRQKFVATNIAREGLELVRVIRDTNSLDVAAAGDWTEFLCGGSGDIHITAESVDAWIPNHDTASPLSNSVDYDSDYVRTIHVDCTNRDAQRRHIEVSSQVTWDKRGNVGSVVVKEKLYDWL